MRRMETAEILTAGYRMRVRKRKEDIREGMGITAQ
jgi:hypothetical protein